MEKNILKIGMVFCIMALLIGISPLTSAQQVTLQVVDEGNQYVSEIVTEIQTGVPTFYCGWTDGFFEHDIPAGMYRTGMECDPYDGTPLVCTYRSSNYIIYCRMSYVLESYNPPDPGEADEVTCELYLEFDGESKSKTIDMTETGDWGFYMEIHSHPHTGIVSYYFSAQIYINGYPYASDHAEGDVLIVRRFSDDLDAQVQLPSSTYETFFLFMLT